MGSRFDDPQEEDFSQPPDEASADDVARYTAAPRPQPIGRFAAAMTGEALAGEDYQTFMGRRAELADRGALGPTRIAASDEERAQDQHGAERVQQQLAKEAQQNDLEQRRADYDTQRAAEAAAKLQAREEAKAAAGYTKMMKNAGALTDMGADGKETVKTDAQGNPIYQPAIVSDVHAHPENGAPVVDVRDATGKVTKQDADKLGLVHVNPTTGERYTRQNGQLMDWGLDQPTVQRNTLRGQVNDLHMQAADDELDIGQKRVDLSDYVNNPKYKEAKETFKSRERDLKTKADRLAEARGKNLSRGLPADALLEPAIKAVTEAQSKVDEALPGWEPFETTHAQALSEIKDAERVRYAKRKQANTLATNLQALAAARHNPNGMAATVQDRAQQAVTGAQQDAAQASQQGDAATAKASAQTAQQTGTLLARAQALKAKRDALDPHTPEAEQAEAEHQDALGSLYEKTVDPSQWRYDAGGVNAEDIVKEAAGGQASGMSAVKVVTIALKAVKNGDGETKADKVGGRPIDEELAALKATGAAQAPIEDKIVKDFDPALARKQTEALTNGLLEMGMRPDERGNFNPGFGEDWKNLTPEQQTQAIDMAAQLSSLATRRSITERGMGQAATDAITDAKAGKKLYQYSEKPVTPEAAHNNAAAGAAFNADDGPVKGPLPKDPLAEQLESQGYEFSGEQWKVGAVAERSGGGERLAPQLAQVNADWKQSHPPESVLSLGIENPLGALKQAVDDGVMSDPDDKTWRAVEARQAIVDSMGPAQAKAAAYGVGRGSFFLGGMPAGGAIGASVPIPHPGVKAAAGILGSMFTGAIAAMGYDKVMGILAKHSTTIQDVMESAELHPNFATAGELVANITGLPRKLMGGIGGRIEAGAEKLAAKSAVPGKTVDEIRGALNTPGNATFAAPVVADNYARAASLLDSIGKSYASGGGGLVATLQNMAKLADVGIAAGKSKGAIAASIAGKVGTGAASLAAIDTALKEFDYQTGKSGERQTAGGALIAAVLGAANSGHGIGERQYERKDIGDIWLRGTAHDLSGTPLGEPLSPESMAELRGHATDINTQIGPEHGKALTPEETEIYNAFIAKAKAGIADGSLKPDPATWTARARQMLYAGRKMGIAALEITPRERDVTSPDGGPASPGGGGPSGAPDGSLMDRTPAGALTAAKTASDAAAAELDRATQQGGVADRAIAMDRAKAFSEELDRRVAGALVLPVRTAQTVNGILGAQTVAVNAALAENPHLATAGVELGRQMRDTYLQPPQVDAAKRVLANDPTFSSNPALADAAINQRVGVLVARDLAGVAQGNLDKITPARLAALDRLGYIREGADGQPVLTQDAVPYLPRKLREDIAKQPENFRVSITPGAAPKLALHDREVGVQAVAEAVAPGARNAERGTGSAETKQPRAGDAVTQPAPAKLSKENLPTPQKPADAPAKTSVPSSGDAVASGGSSLADWSGVLRTANDISIQEFEDFAQRGKLQKATGAPSVNEEGTGKTPLSMGHRSGYSLPDIAHFYLRRRSPETGKEAIGDAAKNPHMVAAFDEFMADAAHEATGALGVATARPVESPKAEPAEATTEGGARKEVGASAGSEPVMGTDGKSFEALTPQTGRTVRGRWHLAEAEALTTSDHAEYDQTLQPRDRGRQASREQVAEIAQKHQAQRTGESATTDLGAPMVDGRGHVLSGNGRVMARRVLPPAKEAAYRHWLLDNSEKLGISRPDIRDMKQPVLVRRVEDFGGMSPQAFAEESNKPQVLGMSDAERASSDARMLANSPGLLDAFRPSEEGDVLAASNRDFLNAFIRGTGASAELLTGDGFNKPALTKRVKNAVLASLLGPENRDLIASLTERAEELGIARVSAGLLNAAPRLVKLAGSPHDPSPLLNKALTDLVHLRTSGEKLGDFLSQAGLFGDPSRTAATDRLLGMLAEAKSAKAVTAPLVRYAELAAGQDTSTGDMFGGGISSPSELFRLAYETPARDSKTQADLALGKPAQPARPAGSGDETDGGGVRGPAEGAGSGKPAAGAAGAVAQNGENLPADIKQAGGLASNAGPQTIGDALLHLQADVTRRLADPNLTPQNRRQLEKVRDSVERKIDALENKDQGPEKGIALHAGEGNLPGDEHLRVRQTTEEKTPGGDAEGIAGGIGEAGGASAAHVGTAGSGATDGRDYGSGAGSASAQSHGIAARELDRARAALPHVKVRERLPTDPNAIAFTTIDPVIVLNLPRMALRVDAANRAGGNGAVLAGRLRTEEQAHAAHIVAIRRMGPYNGNFERAAWAAAPNGVREALPEAYGTLARIAPQAAAAKYGGELLRILHQLAHEDGFTEEADPDTSAAAKVLREELEKWTPPPFLKQHLSLMHAVEENGGKLPGISSDGTRGLKTDEEGQGLLFAGYRDDFSKANHLKPLEKGEAGAVDMEMARFVSRSLDLLREKSGWNSLAESVRTVLSPDSRLSAAEEKEFRAQGIANPVGAARKAGMVLEGVTANMDRNRMRMEVALSTARKMFSHLSLEEQREIQFKMDEGTRVEGPLGQAIRSIALTDIARVEEIKTKLEAIGVDVWKQFQDYASKIIPHIFDNAKAADEILQQMSEDRRRLVGPKGWLKHRTGLPMREIIAYAASKGVELKPKHDNPVDQIMERWAAQDRYFGVHEILAKLAEQGVGAWHGPGYQPLPGETKIDGMRRWKQHVGGEGDEFAVMAEPGADTRALPGIEEDGMPEDMPADFHPMTGAKPPQPRARRVFSSEQEAKDWIAGRPGFAIERRVSDGEWETYAVAHQPATVINNYLSTGHRDKQWVRNYFAAANVLNKVQLGISFFHGGFVTLESMVSQLAMAQQMLVAGRPMGFIRNVFAAFNPVRISGLRLGGKIRKELLNPGEAGGQLTAVVNAMVEHGWRYGEDARFAHADIGKMMDSFRSGTVAGMVNGALRAPFALIEALAHPILSYYVPRLKAAMIYKLAEFHMAETPNLSATELHRRLQEDVRSGMNRFGQMVYDNLHLHKKAKDVLMGSTRSLGWNWGTWAEIGGGIADWVRAIRQGGAFGLNRLAKLAGMESGGRNVEAPGLTNRMSYAVALPLLTFAIGAAVLSLFGKKAKTWVDYFFIPTGYFDDKGNEIRVSLPTYMKDVFHAKHDPVSTVTNKLHPALSTAGHMVANKDYYGTEIRHPGDPAWKQILAEFEYAGKQFLPFTVRNAVAEGGAPASVKLAGALGLTMAPASIGKSDALLLAQKLSVEKMPQGARTAAEFERSRVKSQIVARLRNERKNPALAEAGRPNTAAKQLAAAVEAKTLIYDDLDSIGYLAGLTPLQASVSHLSAEETARVLELATPEEREELMGARTDAKGKGKPSIVEQKNATAAKRGKPGIPLSTAGKGGK